MKRFVPTLLVPLVLAAACGKSDSDVCVPPDAAAADTHTPNDTAQPVDTHDTTTPADAEADSDKPAKDTAEDTRPDTSADVADTTKDTRDEVIVPQCPWQPWDEGLIGGRVDYVGFDPRVPGVVWATSGGALVRSLDSGLDWEPMSDDVAPTQLAFPPDDTKTLLAASLDGLWDSVDVGKTFTSSALRGLVIWSLLAHPAAPQRVFVGTIGAGILRSNDGGKHYQAVNLGVPRMIVDALAAPSNDPDVVVATGVLLNDSDGIANSGVILRSSDGGRSWATTSSDVSWGYDLQACPADETYMLAAVRKGILESRDAGLTWARVPILGQRDVLSIAFPPDRCDAYWVSIYQAGVYRVDDGGLTLTGPLNDGMDLEIERFAGQLSAHPTDPDILLSATHAGLYRSADAGFHWRAVDAAKGLAIFDLDGSGERAWMATWGNRLWTRTLTTPWVKVASVPRDLVASVAPDPADPERALVGTNMDAWYTEDGPDGFALAPGVLNPNDALVFAGPSEIVVATQVSGVVRAPAREGPWTASNTGLEPFPTGAGTFIDTRMLARDPNLPNRVYVSMNGRGVAVSDDRGLSWSRPENALADKQVPRLAAASVGGKTRLFALVAGLGIWVSNDGALTWTTENQGLDSLVLGDLAVDGHTGRAFVTMSGGPIFYSEDGLEWTTYDRWCLPDNGWGALAILEDADGQRWLAAATSGNRVIRRKL